VPLPEIRRQQRQGKDVVARADAAFTKAELYEAGLLVTAGGRIPDAAVVRGDRAAAGDAVAASRIAASLLRLTVWPVAVASETLAARVVVPSPGGPGGDKRDFREGRREGLRRQSTNWVPRSSNAGAKPEIPEKRTGLSRWTSMIPTVILG